MRGAMPLLVILWVVLQGIVTATALPPYMAGNHDVRLSVLESAIIKRITEGIPEDQTGGGGLHEWTIVHSISSDLGNEEALIKHIVEAIPGDRTGGGGSKDWSIVRSISSEQQVPGKEEGEPADMDIRGSGGLGGGFIDGPRLELCKPGFKFEYGQCREVIEFNKG